MIMKFLLILAWVFFVISSIVLFLKWISHMYYNSDMNKLGRITDQLRGVKYTFPVKFWPYVLIFCICFLISYYYL